jgi:hypothetical protein
MLFGVSENVMLYANTRKEKFREQIGWVNDDQGSGSYSSVDVEILHKDYSGSYDIKTAFRNPILMWVRSVFEFPSILNYQPTNNFPGLCCHHSRSYCRQRADEWEAIISKDGHHGSKAQYSKHHTWSYCRLSGIGLCCTYILVDSITYVVPSVSLGPLI